MYATRLSGMVFAYVSAGYSICIPTLTVINSSSAMISMDFWYRYMVLSAWGRYFRFVVVRKGFTVCGWKWNSYRSVYT